MTADWTWLPGLIPHLAATWGPYLLPILPLMPLVVRGVGRVTR